MKRIHFPRIGLIAMVLTGMLGLVATPVSADTTTTIKGSVTVTDAGSLDVHWAGEPVAFLSDGDAPSVSAVDSATATATFSLVIEDTRADENRVGYTIQLSATPFTVEGANQVIAPSRLSIASVDGLPGGIDTSAVIDAPLDGGVTLVSVPSGSDAISTTAIVTVEMFIPAGTFPGTFKGGINLDVIPIT